MQPILHHRHTNIQKYIFYHILYFHMYEITFEYDQTVPFPIRNFWSFEKKKSLQHNLAGTENKMLHSSTVF